MALYLHDGKVITKVSFHWMFVTFEASIQGAARSLLDLRPFLHILIIWMACRGHLQVIQNYQVL